MTNKTQEAPRRRGRPSIRKPSAFGKILNEAIEAKKMTAMQFADKVDVTSSFISAVTLGVKHPPLARVKTWARVLGLRGAARTAFEEEAQLDHCPEAIQKKFRQLAKTV